MSDRVLKTELRKSLAGSSPAPTTVKKDSIAATARADVRVRSLPRQIKRAMEAQITLQAVKLTKARVSSIIKWSPSRHNEITKPRVVADILLGFSQGGLWSYVDASQPLPDGITKTRPLAGEGKYVEGLVEKRSYDSGTYCPGSSMTRYGTYEVDFTKKQILDVENSILYQFA